MGFLIGGLIAALLYLPILPSLLDTVSTVSESSATDVMQEYQNPLWTAFEAIRTGIGDAGPLVPVVGAAGGLELESEAADLGQVLDPVAPVPGQAAAVLVELVRQAAHQGVFRQEESQGVFEGQVAIEVDARRQGRAGAGARPPSLAPAVTL